MLKLKLTTVFQIIFLTKTILSLNILVLTQNQGGLVSFLKNNDQTLTENFQQFQEKLQEKVLNSDVDIILYHVQELVELKAMALFSKGKKQGLLNFIGLKKEELDTKSESYFFFEILQNIFPGYKIKYNPNFSMVTYVIAKPDINFNLKTLKAVNQNEFLKKRTFNNGFWGQKGGIISLVELQTKNNNVYKLISINCHLSSKKSEERQSQYNQLLEETMNLIGDLENYTIFFAGDMNSRLTKIEKTTLKSYHDEKKHYVTEYKNWIFNSDIEFSQNKGSYKPFEEFKCYISYGNFIPMKEMVINFQPTYKIKFKHSSDCSQVENYDTCYKKKGTFKKKPIFGYTDRILFYTSENQILGQMDPQNDYGIIQSKMVSDHYTVFGIFNLSVKKPETEGFGNLMMVKKKVQIKNEEAIEVLKNLLEFLSVTNTDIKQNLLLMLNSSSYFFENAINIYSYLAYKTQNKCQTLNPNSNKLTYFLDIQNKFLKCYFINQQLSYIVNLQIEQINENKNQTEIQNFEQEEESENINSSDEEDFSLKNKKINTGNFDQFKKKYKIQREPPFFNERLKVIENIEFMVQSLYFKDYDDMGEIIEDLSDIIRDPELYEEENIIQNNFDQKGYGLKVNSSQVNRRKIVI